jgi:hypothetical protein
MNPNPYDSDGSFRLSAFFLFLFVSLFVFDICLVIVSVGKLTGLSNFAKPPIRRFSKAFHKVVGSTVW